MLEIWKDIKDFENYYQISNFGRVKALSRKIIYKNGSTRQWPERILKNRFDGRSYHFVTLHKFTSQAQLRVHRLVAEHFLDNFESKPCVNHKDGNRINNTLSNLEWCTHKENTQDGMSRGSIYKPGKKVTESEINSIRKLYRTGEFYQKDLAKLFKLSQTQISRIIRKINWK